MTPLEDFNSLPEAEAQTDLLTCCGSRTWAYAVAQQRPYRTSESMIERASADWFGLSEADWLEAFACHPRIGERKSASSDFLTHSESEQSATQRTIAAVEDRLLAGNRAYEAKFGSLYIVFASGRTAPELLAVLEQRLGNTRAEELQEAARQQDRITRLRLERWLTA